MLAFGACCKRGSVSWLQVGKRCLQANSTGSESGFWSNGVHQTRCMSNSPTRKPEKREHRPVANVAQSFQGKDHEFGVSRSRETVDRAAEYSSFNMEANLGSLDMGGQARHEDPVSNEGLGLESMDQQERDRCEIYSRGEVSLDSVMQSNVPEPFNPQGRNPSHVNMPGGGSGRKNKYLYSHIHGAHPNKQYSTQAGQTGLHDDSVYTTSLQGIQGDDNDALFQQWEKTCKQYHLNCEGQVEAINRGEKTVVEVVQEQAQLLQQIAADYEALEKDFDKCKNSQQARSDLRTGAASVQGIQGANDECLQLWLNNCNKYGFANCDEQLQDVQAGRKNLHEILAEQERLIYQIAKQQRRHYSTDSRRPAGASGDQSEVSGPGDSEEPPSGQLSQRQKLQLAVKQYGSTVIVFHVAISLASLGGFYVAVSSGLDVVGLLTKLGAGESILQSRLATGTSTFVMAYAVHKVFAPVRIAITLTSTPFIVGYLRRVGFLKPPKPS